jgi:hypothetical protein
VASGAVNAGGPLELRAVATAADSTYRGLVRLVEQAQAERPPFARLADRVAGWFVPVTLLSPAAPGSAVGRSGPGAGGAGRRHALPADPGHARSRSPRGCPGWPGRGVIVKGGGALEMLARAETVLLDKTGTVTAGRPRVLDVEPFDDAGPRRGGAPRGLAGPGVRARVRPGARQAARGAASS